MNPNNSSQGGDSPSSQPPQESQSAAANIIRSQIDALYGDQPVVASQTEQEPVNQQSQADINPYERTHEAHPQPQADQWKAYHSAWQAYYQKYYEAFYAYRQSQQQTEQGYFTSQPALGQTHEDTSEELSKDQALFELRQKLLGSVRTRAKKFRTSKHFVPIASAVVVVLIFLFLQYNQVLIANVNAYLSPGAIDPQNIVIDPASNISVSADPRLIIPKINVDAPVFYDIGNDFNSQMDALAKGIAHFAVPGANSHPGEIGNTVLSGHSSSDLFDKGDYKFIFAQLDKLKTGDTIYANYRSKRYTYVVTKKEVVKPTDVSALVYPTTKPIMTLITCTPLGTSLNRLLVTAEQISPDPAAAVAAPKNDSKASSTTTIPGNAPTFLERLFGGAQ